METESDTQIAEQVAVEEYVDSHNLTVIQTIDLGVGAGRRLGWKEGVVLLLNQIIKTCGTNGAAIEMHDILLAAEAACCHSTDHLIIEQEVDASVSSRPEQKEGCCSDTKRTAETDNLGP